MTEPAQEGGTLEAIVEAVRAEERAKWERIEAALRALEAVARSHCREGEPGYDKADVLAYCDKARAALEEA